DYWVRPSAGVKNFAHMVLGGSGLTSVYAMAQYLVDEVLRDMGLALNVKKDFNPIRKDIPHINELSENDMAELIKVDPRFGHIICRCETVSEGEIVEAIKRGARTVDGIKFRTRSGMGRCQGGFCRPRVIKILARELGTNIVDVTRRGSGSNELLYKAKELLN
ncbi:MAG: FAD/NAD(P)-binding oxidoreductase, partial [Firmicutes bacterium]|nr:FAD/NAD(P)-binding oxidoreductase [Bacillota bacterium]